MNSKRGWDDVWGENALEKHRDEMGLKCKMEDGDYMERSKKLKNNDKMKAEYAMEWWGRIGDWEQFRCWIRLEECVWT